MWPTDAESLIEPQRESARPIRSRGGPLAVSSGSAAAGRAPRVASADVWVPVTVTGLRVGVGEETESGGGTRRWRRLLVRPSTCGRIP
jgi:hypothetical protein